MRFTTTEIAQATSGSRIGPNVMVTDVAIDSRTVSPGQLFVPLIAERDGHDFIPAALANGAASFITSRPGGEGPAVAVDDTATALSDIGRTARGRLDGEVIGITGSVGKTSVKDLVESVFGLVRRTHASPRSFNNEIGVPLTLANAPEEAEVVIQEMGARGVGHIAELCAMASPTAGVVTMIVPAHTSEFTSIEEIARAKGELVEAVPSTGFVVLNGDDPLVMAMGDRTDARVVGYGSGAEVTAQEVSIDQELRPRFLLVTPDGSAPTTLSVRGAHQVPNALAAAATGYAAGIEIDVIAYGLAAAAGSPWRMEVRRRSDGVTVINDAYNANPTSMGAAFDALASHPARRRIVVLGTMAELGETSADDHRSVGAAAIDRGFEVVTVAEDGYGTGQAVTTPGEAAAALADIEDGDVVLIKASRAAGLERVADLLLDEI